MSKTKGECTTCKHCTLVDKVIPMRIEVNIFDIVTDVYWNWTIKKKDGRYRSQVSQVEVIICR